jgi:hypothetical protein
VSNTFEDLVRTHLAVVATLQSRLLSAETRRQLQLLREDLEQEIAALRFSDDADSDLAA